MAKLDHIMYAAPDLDQGIAEIEQLTGVIAAPGGTHPGNGTRNALLSLGADQYLEIIAPDPAQNLDGTLGRVLVEHGGSGIRAWAVATHDIAGTKDISRRHGLAPQPTIDMNRTTPDGVRLDWQVFLVAPASESRSLTSDPGLLPFFIDWKDSPHPARTTPGGCTLSEFTVTLPDEADYRSIMEALGVDVSVAQGPPGLSAQLLTPRGLVELPRW